MSFIAFPTIIEDKRNEDGGVIVHDPRFVLLLANVNSSTLIAFVSESTDDTTAVASIPAVALALARTSLDFVLLITVVRIIPRKMKVMVEMIYRNVLSFFFIFCVITCIVSISYCTVKCKCRMMDI